LLLAVFNFTPVPRHGYRVGVPRGGYWKEVLNSDAQVYGGSNQGNSSGVDAAQVK
jgi:1,4-alpha-glucan branching enzyme